MLIAQITDLHIGFDSPTAEDANLHRLDEVLRALEAMPQQPDLLLASGDLTEHGDAASFRLLGERLARCPIRSHLMLGNHDTRAGFREAFPDAPDADGFLQYVVELPSLRLIVLDTLEEGRHAGAFCGTRAGWLADRLDEAPDRPTVIALHHPPFDSGIEWMTTEPTEAWVALLRLALAGRRNIVGMLSGHLHRPVVGSFKRIPVAVAPATAMPLALTLEPMDLDRPDQRPLVTEGPPSYALHRWDNGNFVSHFATTGDARPIVRYDEKIQPFLRRLVHERPKWVWTNYRQRS
jgi:3',5'-cyclic AMP phosphodiesterase CpdA